MDTVKTVETPYNNAVSVITRTNELLLENDIKDSTGVTTAQLDMTPANPAWLFALACGNLHTSWQQQIAKAYAALDPQNCEDDQVLVLAILAGLTRGLGTPSRCNVKMVNNGSEAVTIPYGTEFTETYSNHTWMNNYEIVLQPQAQTVAPILFSADKGAFSVPSGTPFACTDFPNVQIEAYANSILGEDIESISDLRNRLSTGAETNDFIQKTATLIKGLPGIRSCSIWYNQSVVTPMSVGTFFVPPRTALVCIDGVNSSNDIAETYYTYMNSPSLKLETESCHTATYRRGMQDIEMSYFVSQPAHIPIKVRIRATDMAVGAKEGIKQTLISHSGSLECGENVTIQMLSEWLTGFDMGKVIGCYVTNTLGEMLVSSDIQPNQYCVWSADDITVEEDSVVGLSDE